MYPVEMISEMVALLFEGGERVKEIFGGFWPLPVVAEIELQGGKCTSR